MLADDHSLATPPGITLSVVPAPADGELIARENAIGVTAGRVWFDVPATGSLVFYRVE